MTLASTAVHRTNLPTAAGGMAVVPSGAALGAEIRGVDLARPVDACTQAALRQAWADHLVLLFRDQHLDDAGLIAAAEIFGGAREAGGRRYYASTEKGESDHRVTRDPRISVMSNLDARGNPVLDNGALGSYEVMWHSDNSYVAEPPAGSMLYALEIPPDGGGGATSFNNQYLAYEQLPEALKSAIRGRVQRHDSSRNSAGVLRPGARLPTTLDEVEGPAHPLVRIHPVTGRAALYLGRRRVWPSNHVVGMPDLESQALLGALWDHATQPKYAWTHTWRVGDLVLWDNRCSMHHRTPIDTRYRRVLHRTVIRGEPIVAAP